ncbi:MAG: hypothetical protein RL514_1912 [Verrucomicrobiota bacterium]|jgi:hypothetical protein
MHSLTRSLLTLAAALAFTLLTPDASAAAKKMAPDTALHGKITAVDKEAKTIAIAGKTLTVDETTVITDSGKPAKFDSLKIGTEATVSTFMLGEKLNAVSIKTGVVAATAAAPKKKK